MKYTNLPSSLFATISDMIWIVLGIGLVLATIGLNYYSKGLSYGLTEDHNGRPIILKNKTKLIGKILIIVGGISIITTCVIFCYND